PISRSSRIRSGRVVRHHRLSAVPSVASAMVRPSISYMVATTREVPAQTTASSIFRTAVTSADRGVTISWNLYKEVVAMPLLTDPRAVAGLVVREIRNGERDGAPTKIAIARRSYPTDR